MTAPRNGQWMKFHVPDPLASKMRGNGCFETPDGFFLSIYAEGVKRLMVVDSVGDNVPVMRAGKVENLCFECDEVKDLRPMTSRLHFPPGYKGHTDKDPRP